MRGMLGLSMNPSTLKKLSGAAMKSARGNIVAATYNGHGVKYKGASVGYKFTKVSEND